MSPWREHTNSVSARPARLLETLPREEPRGSSQPPFARWRGLEAVSRSVAFLRLPSLDLQSQNLSRLALREHFERSATHLAVRDQFHALAAIRALNAFGDFHSPNETPESPPREPKFSDRPNCGCFADGPRDPLLPGRNAGATLEAGAAQERREPTNRRAIEKLSAGSSWLFLSPAFASGQFHPENKFVRTRSNSVASALLPAKLTHCVCRRPKPGRSCTPVCPRRIHLRGRLADVPR